MNFSSKESHESNSCEGVRFTVRRLNEIQRAKRDAKLIDARARISEMAARLSRLPDPDGQIAELRAKAANEDRAVTTEELTRIEEIEAEASEPRLKRARIDHEISVVISTELKPAYIRAGLLAIEGLEIDDKPATVDGLIESGPSELVGEIYAACYAASELSIDQRKNLQSPTTSQEAADGGENITTATAAAA